MATATCERCGSSVKGGTRFCGKCGFAQPVRIEGSGGEPLQRKLAAAADAVRHVLDSAAAGKLTEEQLLPQLFRVGLVIDGDSAYMLDVQNARIYRYDGLEVEVQSPEVG